MFFYPKEVLPENKAGENGTEYKISFRSGSDTVNVAEIAMHYGGGGHIRAAGASTTLEPEACLSQILELMKQQIIHA